MGDYQERLFESLHRVREAYEHNRPRHGPGFGGTDGIDSDMQRFEAALCAVEAEFWEPIRKLVGRHLSGCVEWRDGAWDSSEEKGSRYARRTPRVFVADALRQAIHETQPLVSDAVRMRVEYGVEDDVRATTEAAPTQEEPAREGASGASTDALGVGARITGETAAELIGVSPSTLSRWHTRTPIWAQGNERLFGHLMDREEGRYLRDRVLKLARWSRKAREDGGQREIACP